MENQEMNKYDTVIQNVKAFFFDNIYREQGLVDVFTKRIDGFSPDVKEQLGTLFTRQTEDIERILSLLTEVSISMKKIEATGKEIEAISAKNISNEVVFSETASAENNFAAVEASGAALVPEAVSAEQGVVTGSEVVAQPVEGNNLIADNVKQPEVESYVENKTQADVAPVVDSEQNESSNVNFNGGQDAVVVPQVTPAAEGVQISDQTGIMNEESVNSSDTELKEPAGQFVLSPIDDGVLPASTEERKDVASDEAIASAERQLQAIETVKDDITTDPNLTPEQKEESLRKYTRATQSVVKAILVTKAQYEKLSASRATQQALQDAKQNSTTTLSELDPSITNDTPKVIENGQAQDKQNELESMMNQANLLYKEGKTQEAQEIYNKISNMNKAIQTENAGGTAYTKK